MSLHKSWHDYNKLLYISQTPRNLELTHGSAERGAVLILELSAETDPLGTSQYLLFQVKVGDIRMEEWRKNNLWSAHTAVLQTSEQSDIICLTTVLLPMISSNFHHLRTETQFLEDLVVERRRLSNTKAFYLPSLLELAIGLYKVYQG